MRRLLKNLREKRQKLSFSETFKDFLPRCQNCPNPSFRIFCEACFEVLRFKNSCSLCGHIPLSDALEFCVNCRDKTGLFEKLYFSFFYTNGVKSWIYEMKENHKTERFRELMKEHLPCFDPLPDGLVSISADPVRFRQRLFNPAARLARRLGAILKIPVFDDVFVRTPFLEAQKDLPLGDRMKYLKNTVKIKNSLPSGLRRVLLVDDIMTSGATLRVHANLLKDFGLLIDIYCLARTPKNGFLET